MDAWMMSLQGAMVIALIAVGVHYKGLAIGLFGALGVLLFAILFQQAPGSLPVTAMLIILTVVTAAGAMQLAGGIDYLVSLAQKVIRRFPRQITLVAPLTTFVFCAGAGTGNIYYSLMPVIYEVAYANKIRPERPLALSATAGQLALTASPVSAAMAAMVGLLAPLGFTLVDILIITLPASIVAIVVGSIVMNLRGKELDHDAEYQRRLKAGEIAPPKPLDGGAAIPAQGKRSALIFLAGIAVVIVAGIFPALRPLVEVKGQLAPLDMSQMIQVVMFTVAALIVASCRVKAGEIAKSTLFTSGITAVVALFGVAWMANTFIAANETLIVGSLGELARQTPLMIAVALFIVAALTTSQSSATFSIIPIGIALGIAPAYLVAMWPVIVGVFLLPTNGSQIASVEIDQTGSTRIGSFVINHSFIVPVAVFSLVTMGVGFALAVFMR
jgi:anaerobic C4-dicarboxylate transporter-like protein